MKRILEPNQDLTQIFSSSELSEEEKLKVHKILCLQKQIDEVRSVNTTESYKKVCDKIERVEQKSEKYRLQLFLIATVIILLLCNGLLLGYSLISDKSEEVQYTEVTSAPGLISKLTLPDNSTVWLNSGTTLRYPLKFQEKKRYIELKGEAFFEVDADEESPFIVSTPGGLEIEATGTSFNVIAENNTLKAVLVEGTIRANLSDTFSKVIEPNEEIIFDINARSYELNQVDVQEKTAWKEGKIIFRNAPLDEMFRQLSKRYNVDIVLHDKNNSASKYHSRVIFTDETIQQIFSYLEVAAPISWKVTKPTQRGNSTIVKQRIDVWFK